MKKLFNISIRYKIILIIVGISIISVSLGLLINLLNELGVHKKEIKAFVLKDAHLVGDYCIMPLEFGYPERVEEILDKLRTNHDYSVGAIYNIQDTLFAFSAKEGQNPVKQLKSSEAYEISTKNYFEVYEPIVLEGKKYGTVYLKLKTDTNENAKRIINISLLTLLGVIVIAFFLAAKFQQIISVPILKLANTASEISKSKNYSVQIENRPNDEIGILYDNFTQMLDAINSREKERDIATQALISSEENFKNIFNNSSDGIILANLEGQIIEVNKTFCKFLGYKPSELISQSISTFTTSIYDKQRPEIIKALRTGESITFETEHISKSQEIFPVEINSKFIKYKGNSIILSIVRNIAERKKSEQALLFETNVNKALADISKEIISVDISIINISNLVHLASKNLTNSREGIVSYINPATEDNIAYAFDSIFIDTDSQDQELIFTKKDNEYEGILGYALNKRKGFFTNTPHTHPAGTAGFKDLSKINNFLSVPAIANNRIVGQIALCNSQDDFTEKQLEIIEKIANIFAAAVLQKQTNEELFKAKEKAEESDRLKSAFLANMSHEIRTPMNGIIGFAELLRQKDISQESLNKYVDIINHSSQQLLTIINDIIDISKIETGIVNIENTRFLLNELVDEILLFFQPLAEKKKLNLNIERNSVEDILLYSDRGKLRQILTNLAYNALKFTKIGSITIGYYLDKSSNTVSVYVKDTGIGIAKEYHSTIFERFKQVESHLEGEIGGTGLGLAICSALSKALNYDLTLESELGKGSKFNLNMTYSDIVNKQIQAVITQPENKAKLAGATVLVVEDEIINYQYLEEILVREGAIVLWAKNGLQAIEQVLEKDNIKIILMDIKLPVMDGFTAARKIKNYKNHIPIIAQTAYGLSNDREKTIAAGCDDYISKPIKRDQLFKIIEKYI